MLSLWEKMPKIAVFCAEIKGLKPNENLKKVVLKVTMINNQGK